MKPETRKAILEYTAQRNVIRHRLDFDVGYLVKSPCRECDRENFPECIDDCKILDKIHTMLAGVISCTRNF